METKKSTLLEWLKGSRKEIKENSKSIWDVIKGKENFSQEESTMAQVIVEILEMKNTQKLTPYNGEIYLINSEVGNYVKIKKNRVWIIGRNNSIVKDCTQNFIYFVNKTINDKIIASLEEINSEMFTANLTVLKDLGIGQVDPKKKVKQIL